MSREDDLRLLLRGEAGRLAYQAMKLRDAAVGGRIPLERLEFAREMVRMAKGHLDEALKKGA